MQHFTYWVAYVDIHTFTIKFDNEDNIHND